MLAYTIIMIYNSEENWFGSDVFVSGLHPPPTQECWSFCSDTSLQVWRKQRAEQVKSIRQLFYTSLLFTKHQFAVFQTGKLNGR